MFIFLMLIHPQTRGGAEVQTPLKSSTYPIKWTPLEKKFWIRTYFVSDFTLTVIIYLSFQYFLTGTVNQIKNEITSVFI